MNVLLPLLALALTGPPADLKEPAISYWKAATNGSAFDAGLIGLCYLDGGKGAPQDDKQALYWIQKSADGHDGQGERVLARSYEQGALGLKADPAKAYSWMHKAAEDGDDVALFEVSEHLYKGDVCPADPHTSYAALLSSGFRSNEDACCALARAFYSGNSKMGAPRNRPLAYLWCIFASHLSLEPDDAKRNKELQDHLETELKPEEIARLKNRWQEIKDYAKSYDFLALDTSSGESIALPQEGVDLKEFQAHLQLGGEKHDFLVDTGCSMSMISAEIAHRLKLKAVGWLPSPLTPLDPPTPIVEASGSVNGVPFHNLRFVVVAMSKAFPTVELEGTLGGNFIRLVRFKLDGPQNKIVLLPPTDTATPPAPETSSIPLQFSNGVPKANVTVESASHESFSVLTLIDTGNWNPVIMNAEVNAEHPFTKLVGRTAVFAMQDIGGVSFDPIGRLQSLTIGPCRLSQPLLVYQPGTSEKLNVGMDAFQQCVATFDYAHACLELVPAKTVATDVPYSDIGYRATPGPGNIRTVALVYPGGPAEQAGLKVGDVFQTIDGKPAASFVGKDVSEVFPEGTHTLIVKRGDVSVTLKMVVPPAI